MEVAQIRNEKIRFNAFFAVHTVMTKTDLSHMRAKENACSVNIKSRISACVLILFVPEWESFVKDVKWPWPSCVFTNNYRKHDLQRHHGNCQ